jgi:hypothetical protein
MSEALVKAQLRRLPITLNNIAEEQVNSAPGEGDRGVHVL